LHDQRQRSTNQASNESASAASNESASAASNASASAASNESASVAPSQAAVRGAASNLPPPSELLFAKRSVLFA
jgi:hypothetical protein